MSTLNTIDYLKKENVDFIKPDVWLPNSSDVTAVDYAVWGAFWQRVYHGRKFNTVEELKRAMMKKFIRHVGNIQCTMPVIITDWHRQQCFIDSSINE